MSKPQKSSEDTLARVLCERIEQLNELEHEMRARHLKLAQILGELSAWAAQTRPQDGIQVPVNLIKLSDPEKGAPRTKSADVSREDEPSRRAGSNWWVWPIFLILAGALVAGYLAWQGLTQELQQLRKELQAKSLLKGSVSPQTGGPASDSDPESSPSLAGQAAPAEGQKDPRPGQSTAPDVPNKKELLELRPQLFASKRKCPSKEPAAIRRFRERLASTRGVPVRQELSAELVTKVRKACPHNRGIEERSAALRRMLSTPSFEERKALADAQSLEIPGDQRFDLRMLWLPGGKLDRLNLSFSDLRGAHLEGAKLFQSDLRNARLGGAYLVGANLTHAQLRGAKLDKSHLEGANLNAADLRGATLDGADLRAVRLPHANLEGASLNGADLRLATFEQTNFRRASLRGVRFAELNLRGLNLREADLSESKSLDCRRLLQADTFEGAILPDSLRGSQCADVVDDPKYWERRNKHAVGDVQGRAKAKEIADAYWKQTYARSSRGPGAKDLSTRGAG